MACSIKNSGGGMVELFSQSWTDTASTHSFTVTDELKQKIAEYDLIVITNTAQGTRTAGTYGNIAFMSNILCASHLAEFMNKETPGYYDYYQYLLTGSAGSTGNDTLNCYFIKSGSEEGTIKYLMVYTSGRSAQGTSEIKFYGIKL